MKQLCILFLSMAFIFSYGDIKAQYITTICGNGASAYSGDGGPAIIAEVYRPSGIAMDTAGNIYIGDGSNYRVRKITPANIITTVAGTGIWTGTFTGAGGPATAANIAPVGVAVDRHGNLYIGAGDFHVLIVSPAGIVSNFAGTGTSGHTGDGGPATAAEIQGGSYVAVDTTGNLYIADGTTIRKVNTSNIISTIA